MEISISRKGIQGGLMGKMRRRTTACWTHATKIGEQCGTERGRF